MSTDNHGEMENISPSKEGVVMQSTVECRDVDSVEGHVPESTAPPPSARSVSTSNEGLLFRK